MNRPAPLGVTLIIATASLLTAACGGGSSHPPTFNLSTADATVCRAAATGNARTVYNTRTKAANRDLKTQIAKIYPGSSDATDKTAIKHINAICTQHHFATPTTGT